MEQIRHAKATMKINEERFKEESKESFVLKKVSKNRLLAMVSTFVLKTNRNHHVQKWHEFAKMSL